MPEISLDKLLSILLFLHMSTNLMAEQTLIFDSGNFDEDATRIENRWRVMTDQVMGGISKGSLIPERVEGKHCWRLRGNVQLENNGGFIQATLDLKDTEFSNASNYAGLLLTLYGNGEDYNLHLRTRDVWLPWQSYRTTFHTAARWQTIEVPFSEFTSYRIGKRLDLEHLTRIGLVAIGRAFFADLCIARVGLYREND